jgi:hypothetical protein
VKFPASAQVWPSRRTGRIAYEVLLPRQSIRGARWQIGCELLQAPHHLCGLHYCISGGWNRPWPSSVRHPQQPQWRRAGRPWLDRRLGCDVRADAVRAGAMICAIAMVPANITGAPTNAIVVLSRHDKARACCRKEMSLLSRSRQAFALRPAFPLTIYFLLAILIGPPVHNRVSANVQLLS